MTKSIVPGAFNLRELGGYQVRDGVIAPATLYRSDLLNRIDVDAAHRWLDTSNVRTLVDLRTAGERSDDGAIESSDTLSARHRSLLNEVWSWKDEHEAPDEWFLRDRTVEMFVDHGDRIATVLEDLASNEGAVLFHCTAGKDRTGVIACALLGILGADDELIIADYAASTDAMVGIVGWYRDLAERRAAAEGVEPPQFSEAAERSIIERAAAPATMRGVIDTINNRYGGFEQWAKGSGIDDALISALRAKFVQ